MPKTSSTNEIRPLTSLRAVAAGMVVFFHYYYHHYGDPMPLWLRPIGHQGYFAVDIFFVLSGFVLAVRYAPEIRAREFHWGDYLLRRVARIWPLYYLILGTWFLVGTPINWSHLTFTQGYFFEYWPTGNNVSWSLSIEESFYLLLPLILMSIVRRHAPFRLALWSVLMPLAGVLLVIISNVFGLPDSFHGFMLNLRFMADRTIFGYLPEFAMGIGCGLWYLKHGAPGKRPAWWLLIVGIIGVLGVMTYVSQGDGVDIQPFGWIIGIFATLLIWGLTNTETIVARVMSHPFPVYLGRISFALYLLHTGPIVAVSQAAPSPVFYAFGNVVAAIFHELIEKPGHRMVMSLGRRKPSKIPPVEPLKNS